MTLQELLPQLKELTTKEKLVAIEFLHKDLQLLEEQEPLATYQELMELNSLNEEERKLFSGEIPAVIYTPFGMEETAAQIMEMLKNE